ncbi:hypothetical protein [Streptomyces antibioticus]|uniref:hypothetical protein n=1 Tax=Streptomyces antibioticus TaxID=1890 RepID=UPI0036FFAAB5
MSIENTQHPDSVRTTAFLAYATGETDSLIADQERRGQQQLVHSDRLPSRLHEFNGSDAEFEALGFRFGEPDPKDPLFRPATLPDGWTKTGSDHDMWSYVIDQHGRRRVAVFYKAAFYDRRAFMRLISLDAYISDCQHKGVDVVTDDVWATPAAVAEAATALARNRQARVDEWTQLATDRGTSPDLERYAVQYAEERDAFAAIAAQHTTA